MNKQLLNTSLLLALVFFLFPIAHFKILLFGMPVYFSELPIILFILVFLFKKNSQKINWRMLWKANEPILISVSVLLVGMLLSYVSNTQTLTGLGMVKSFFVFPILLFFFLGIMRQTPQARLQILWFWLSGLVIMAWLSLIYNDGGVTYDGRLRGIYESPNHLAFLVSPGILLSLFFSLTLQKKLLKLGSFLFLILLSATLFGTKSYNSIAGASLAATLFLWLTRREFGISAKKLFFGCGILLSLLLVIVFPTEKFQALVQNDVRSSFASRQMIWESAILIARDHPMLGIGPGNFQTEYLQYQKYFSPYLEWAVPQPHNLFLAWWLETGLFGLVGFVSLLIYSVWLSVRAYTKNPFGAERTLGALLFATLFYYGVVGILDTPYFKNDLAFAFWGTLGLLLGWAKESLQFYSIDLATDSIRKKESRFIAGKEGV